MFKIKYCFVAESFRHDFTAKSPVILDRENLEHRELEIINFFYFSFAS